MATPPPIRRIITGHDTNGKAIFDSDTTLSMCDPFIEDGSPPAPGTTIPGFVLIHKTEGYPAKVQGPPVEYHGKIIPLSDESGAVCRIVDFPPTHADTQVYRAGLMHRTQSLDLAVVLKGSIKLELDDRVEKTVSEGDVIVQRGTIHSWKNHGTENCRIMFVLIPSEPVKNETTGEVMGPTHVPGIDKD